MPPDNDDTRASGADLEKQAQETFDRLWQYVINRNDEARRNDEQASVQIVTTGVDKRENVHYQISARCSLGTRTYSTHLDFSIKGDVLTTGQNFLAIPPAANPPSGSRRHYQASQLDALIPLIGRRLDHFFETGQ